MVQLENSGTGRFCWLDLAASDAASAKQFYGLLFGWTSQEHLANGGSFTRLRLSDRDVGSVYQLKDPLLADGMLSHWTPYVRVEDVEDSARLALQLGGAVVVRPFAVNGVARIALILDSVGATVGLWQPIGANMESQDHG